MSDDSIDPKMNPWIPMTRPIDLKYLGKFSEELGECQSAVARCIIQGIGECEPITLKSNKIWLQEEIADVLANIELVVGHFGLDKAFMVKKAKKKVKQLRSWHEMLAD